MKQVILIGTVHLGLTAIDELTEEVLSHKPDRVLIEADKDGNGAQEMQLLLSWCKNNNIEYRCFDESLPAEKESGRPNPEELESFTKEIKDKLSSVSWKDLNNRSVWESTGAETINQAFTEKFYDANKIKDRNKLIDQNIPPLLAEGINVIVTGAGHLSHLLESIPGSVAPLRSK